MHKRILIVDDEADLAESIQSFLTLQGYEAHFATAAKQAILKYKQQPYDLVISDVLMPEQDGVDFYLEIKDILKSNKSSFIFMSSSISAMSAPNAYDLEVDEFILKPFNLAELKTMVDLVLRQADAKVQESKFFRVLLQDYIQSSVNLFDVYLNIDSHYMCLAKKGQELSSVRLQNYQRKGLEYIYLAAEDYTKYMEMQFAISNRVATKPLEHVKKIKLYTHLTKTISTSAYGHHMNAEIFKKALTSFENYSQISFDNDEIFNVLEGISKENMDVTVRASQISFLATAVAIHWKWTNPKILGKIAMAGLLCDVGLSSTPNLFGKNRGELTNENAKHYENHPHLSFEMLSAFKNIPEEVLLVAQQHHEDESGLGFPLQLAKEKQHPFSRLIHAVVEFLDHVEMIKNKSDIKQGLDILLGFKDKQISLQVLKSFYLIFHFDVPKEINGVLLPYELV